MQKKEEILDGLLTNILSGMRAGSFFLTENIGSPQYAVCSRRFDDLNYRIVTTLMLESPQHKKVIECFKTLAEVIPMPTYERVYWLEERYPEVYDDYTLRWSHRELNRFAELYELARQERGK